MSPRSKDHQRWPGLHYEKPCEQAEGGGEMHLVSALFSSELPSMREMWSYWRESSQVPLRWWRDWSLSPGRKGWERWTIQPGDEKAWARQDIKYLHKFMKGECKDRGKTLFSGAWWKDKRQWVQAETQGFAWTSRNTLLWESWRLRLPREVMESPSLKLSFGSGQLALAGPAWAFEVGPDDLQRCLLTSPFCDSVKCLTRLSDK